jgi:hypothetical protein
VSWKQNDKDALKFETGQWLTMSREVSQAGVSEPAFALLEDGRVLVILRASGNEIRGTFARRYYALSSDGGWTWGAIEELKYDDGQGIDVPESMSHLIRSSRTGKVYWVGNICDKPTRECYPRNRVVIAELDQARITVKRDTVTVLDNSPLGEGERKYSNFLLYEDRFSRNLIAVIPELTAAGPRAHPDFVSSGYRYTIEV